LLVDARAAVEATYGAKGLTLLGLGQAVPVDPSVLATTAAAVVKALRDGGIKLPKPKRAGLKLDRGDFADEIDAELPALQKALATVAKEDREKEATQRAKNTAMERNDTTFSRGAGWLAASCLLAGLDDIAGKVRPSGRRPGRTASTDEEGDASGGATGPAAPVAVPTKTG
jgi:hypothetical protein